MSQFWNDLNDAKRVELLALGVFKNNTDKYSFVSVHDNPEYFKKGDIIATAADGRKIFLEIKGDKVIGSSQNVFCEEENFWYNSGTFTKGNFYNDYQIYCVVSESTRKIYIMDFRVLKEHYNKHGHTYKKVSHFDNDSYGYLFPLAEVKSRGGLIATLEY